MLLMGSDLSCRTQRVLVVEFELVIEIQLPGYLKIGNTHMQGQTGEP
jgi:hypothetical protein